MLKTLIRPRFVGLSSVYLALLLRKLLGCAFGGGFFYSRSSLYHLFCFHVTHKICRMMGCGYAW